MKYVAHGASMAVLICLSGGSAQAAITADQLWAAWQDAGAQAGLSVTAEAESREGTSLRLSGVTVSVTTPDDPATVAEAIIEEILLTEGADGHRAVAGTFHCVGRRSERRVDHPAP